MQTTHQTDDSIHPSQSMRDPLGLLSAELYDLILTTLANAYGLSPPDLPSLYLARSTRVSSGAKDEKLFMRFDLHIKELERGPDVAVLSLEFVAKPVKLIEG